MRRKAEPSKVQKRSKKSKITIPAKVEKDTATFSLARDGFKYASKTGVQGGMEFEFASKINHADFAVALAKKAGINKNSIRVLPTYVHGGSSHKDYSKWSVESDNSIDTDKDHTFRIELVTPVMPVKEMIEAIDPVFALIKEHGLTNDNAGLHMTLSSPRHSIIRDMDAAKLLTMVSEHYVAEEFHRTEQTRFAKRMIPDLINKVQTQAVHL
jgi:hypothetical protein